jgi:hypothetical protein
MAKTNSEAFAELSRSFDDVVDRLRELAKPDDPYEPDPSTDTDATPGIRVVQLFFDQDNVLEFHELSSRLAAEYGTDGVTDTVLEAVTREAAK